MPAGRPQKADPGTLYFFAHLFYWDFKLLVGGRYRWRYDEKKLKQMGAEINLLAAQSVTPQQIRAQLSLNQISRLEEYVEEEIQAGRLDCANREARLRDLEHSNFFVNLEFRHMQASKEATYRLKIPGEPEVFDELLRAETPAEVTRICNDAFVSRTIEVAPGQKKDVVVPNWPISAGSMLPHYLSQYASEFIAARKDPRFPRSTHRPTSGLKQLWFLSRALAGALYGVRTRTAINLVGSMRPEQIFEESRDGKPARKRMRMRARRRSRYQS